MSAMHRAGMLWLLLFMGDAAAQQRDATVPQALEPWRAWVLQEDGHRDCPLLSGGRGAEATDYVCAWPGTLQVQVEQGQARFQQRWHMDIAGWVGLPGDASTWPGAVTVDGRAHPVTMREGRPSVWLGQGSSEVRGVVQWDQRPQALELPPATAVVELVLDGRRVHPVQRDGTRVTLGRAAAQATEADALDVRVYRRLSDGIPALLETRLELAGSGEAREQRFRHALPEGFAALSLRSDWPARLDADGSLRVQVQADTGTLVILARAMQPLASVTAPAPDAPWPAQEVWSYQTAPNLRITRAEGPLALDPRRAGVPAAWESLPTFALAAGETLAIEERQRGADPEAGNRLALERSLWRDHDGGGWTLRDTLRGRMRTDWRLEVPAPLVLEHARELPGNEALLITTLEGDAGRGVEWRLPEVSLAAGLRIDASGGRLPVAGWNQTFESVHGTLHLPPGHRLLAAPGADRGSGSWVSRWTLLDLFLVAVAVLLAWHVAGVAGALASGGYLVLAYGESGAPLFSLIALIALVLVARALPAGGLARAARAVGWAAVVLVVLFALPWAAGQARWALYPQLAVDAPHRAAPVQYAHLEAAVVFDDPSPMSTPAPPPPASSGLDRIEVTGSRVKRAEIEDGYSQSTLVQTGRALPEWQRGNVYRLRWNGPVRSDETWRPWISPPWLTGLWRLLSIGLLGLALWLIVAPRRRPVPPPATAGTAARPATGAAGPTAALLLATLLGGTPGHAGAQTAFPPTELLDALRERLTQPPSCAPDCLHVAQAQVVAAQGHVDVTLEVHAQTRLAVPLALDGEGGAPVRVLVDGQAAAGVLARQGRVLVPVERGVRHVQLRFEVIGERSRISFPVPPARVLVEPGAWQVEGVSQGRVPSGTLTLTRPPEPRAGDAAGLAAATTDEQFAPYVRVVRTLSLDRIWTVDTAVTRMSPERGGFGVNLPLLEGERVMTPGLRRVDGQLALPFEASQPRTMWHSELDRQPHLQLRAPPLSSHAETWHVRVGPMWRVDFQGVPESVAPDDDDAGRQPRTFVFHPLPGETLRVTIREPEVAEGATLAIDRVELDTRQGERIAEHTLSLQVRSSQGGEHVVGLPPGSTVLSVRRDGEDLGTRPRDDRLSLPLQPGPQRFELRVQTEQGIAAHSRVPRIDVGSPPANVSLSLSLPESRWVLWTHGPRQGPAVLYWGELLVVVLLALALARSRLTRLRTHQWVLLALGFSMFSWGALVLVAGWLVAMDWRARTDPDRIGRGFNFVQIGLVLLSACALLAVVRAIPHGLLGMPDMHVVGHGSDARTLRWFADRSDPVLPAAGTWTAPMWLYRVLMLAWAIWLAAAVVGWVRAGFSGWTYGGYWRPWRASLRTRATATPDAPPMQEEGDPRR